MCMMVYLAADQPLRLIEWVDADPGFHVSRLPPEVESVRAHFSKPNVYYAGSHEGCGCGFHLDEQAPDAEDPEELARRRRCLDDFSEYLRSELARIGTIEIFSCWSDDEEVPAEHRRVLTPGVVRSPGFYFLENELSVVVEDAATPKAER